METQVMGLFAGVPSAVVLATCLTFAAYVAQIWIAAHEKKRALRRLVADRWVREGGKMVRLVDPASGAVLMEDCHISRHKLGEVEVMSEDKKTVMNFTGQEFEKLHPVWMNQ